MNEFNYNFNHADSEKLSEKSRIVKSSILITGQRTLAECERIFPTVFMLLFHS